MNVAARPNEPAAPDQQPAYLDRCGKMDFGELRRLIDESLGRLPNSNSDADRPCSKEELLDLWDLLREKAGVSDCSPKSPPWEPSEKLSSMRARRDRTLTFLKEASGDPSVAKKDIFKAERSLRAQERDIAQVEDRERQAFAGRRSRYSRTPTPDDTRMRAVERIRREIERAFKPQPTGRVQWKPLPKGEATPAKIRRYYRERLRSQGRLDVFDQDRLDKAVALDYEDWLVPTEGLGGFDLYSIITFAHTEKVLLECPIYGNAVYVVNSNEERWSEMTKQDLIESGDAKRIPHQGQDWYEKYKRELDIR